MTRLRQFTKRSTLFIAAFSLFGAWVLGDVALFVQHADAAQITSRSLTLSSSANGTVNVGNPGEGGNGQEARHEIGFTIPTTDDVDSISFLWCTTPLPVTTCTTPTGLTVANVTTVDEQAGFTGSAFALDATTNNSAVAGCNGAGASTVRENCLLVNRTGDNSENASTTFTVAFGGNASDYITNPTNDNEDFFVRITTYSDGSYATAVDQGTVASSTAQQIDITAKVQEILNFSVGTTATVPDTTCDPLTGSDLGLGDNDDVLSFQQAYDDNSYFRVSTNANTGTSISYSGDTLTLVGDTVQIAPVDNATPEVSNPGTEQFGIAVDSGDATPNGFTFNSLVAQAPYDAGDGSIDGSATPQEATFAFDATSVTTPVEIATSVGSATETIVCDTGSVRYLGNVSTTTSAGIYTTTITFIAAPIY